MKFEMPKMNVAIFSSENIVTTSTNIKAAQDAIVDATKGNVNSGNVTTVATAAEWTQL